MSSFAYVKLYAVGITVLGYAYKIQGVKFEILEILQHFEIILHFVAAPRPCLMSLTILISK